MWNLTVKNYKKIIPVITFIWLVDDTLHTTENYLSYSMTPEIVSNILQNDELWRSENITQLLAKRLECISIMKNTSKQLNFLHENKLIFAMQPNIVNSTMFTKYKRWFQFAKISKDTNNVKQMFSEYEHDEVFAEVIRRLDSTEFDSNEMKEITDFAKYEMQSKRHDDNIRDDGIDIGIDIGKEMGIEIGQDIGKEKGIEIGKEMEKWKL